MKLKIGETIRAHRKSMGLTQEQLAEVMGVTVGAVSKWESAQSNPDIAMLPVLADFFEISVDVLLGYEMKGKSMDQILENIKNMQLEKRYTQGCTEVRKALQKYPNQFDIVYQSARLFHMKGCEQNDSEDLHMALELYNRACALMPQNTDASVSELLIQKSIGQIYMSLNKWEQAVEHLKKYNFCGVNNGDIGILLALTEKYDQAFGYLSESFLDCVLELFHAVVGLANCYFGKGDRQKVRELYLWMHSVITGLRMPEGVSYLDKLEAILYFGCAQISAEENQMDTAKMYLRQAWVSAKRFDDAPDYNPCKIKFYRGKRLSLTDDFGETAMMGIERQLKQNGELDSQLLLYWKTLRDGGC